MDSNNKRWKNLFFFGFGLALGASFCMKWMEKDFWVNGEKFSIIGLELQYSRERLMSIMSGLDAHVRAILGYHLYFDFAFMAGIYPAIASSCMLAREKIVSRGWKKFFLLLALAQTLAWAFDIIENYFLLKWINQLQIDGGLIFFHTIVILKWSIALFAVVIAIPVVLRRKRNRLARE